jgi:hypothetical protein
VLLGDAKDGIARSRQRSPPQSGVLFAYLLRGPRYTPNLQQPRPRRHLVLVDQARPNLAYSACTAQVAYPWRSCLLTAAVTCFYVAVDRMRGRQPHQRIRGRAHFAFVLGISATGGTCRPGRPASRQNSRTRSADVSAPPITGDGVGRGWPCEGILCGGQTLIGGRSGPSTNIAIIARLSPGRADPMWCQCRVVAGQRWIGR